MRKRFLFCLACMAALSFSGCWDKAELESRGFVISLGIDKAANVRGFDVFMTLPNVAAIAGKDGTEGNNRTILHAQADALSAAMHAADASVGQSLYYGHTKIAIFGANCLMDATLFKQSINSLDRNSELSQKLIILATEGAAAEILAAKSPGEPLIGTFVANFYKNNEDSVNATVKTDLEQLLLALNTTGHAILPRIAIEDGEVKLSGAAVLKDAALAGWLDEVQTRGYLWLHGEGKGAILTVPHEGLRVPFRILQCKRTLTFEEVEGRLICRVKLDAKGSVEEMTVSPDMLIDDDTLNTLARQFESEIERELQETFALFQNEYRMDAPNLLGSLYKQNPSLYRKYAQDRDEAFCNMQLETDIHISIVR